MHNELHHPTVEDAFQLKIANLIAETTLAAKISAELAAKNAKANILHSGGYLTVLNRRTKLTELSVKIGQVSLETGAKLQLLSENNARNSSGASDDPCGVVHTDTFILSFQSDYMPRDKAVSLVAAVRTGFVTPDSAKQIADACDLPIFHAIMSHEPS